MKYPAGAVVNPLVAISGSPGVQSTLKISYYRTIRHVGQEN